MADSVLVFPPGFRVTDANDNPVNNAKIKFREAGPGATKTVHSDQNLTVALGHTVRTRADGQPVVSEGSSTTVLIYVGPAAYHLEITDANDAVIVPAKDNIKGAAVLTSVAPPIPPIQVITTGSPLTLDATHKGKLINATSTTLTFGDPATLGDGWHVYVRNNGASGQVILSAASGISFEGQSFTLRALLPGEGMHIACDGTAFRVITHAAPLLASQGPGVIQIADRVSAAPGAPTPGARYIVTANFSSFTTHQIIEYNGTGFNAYTPAADCGWIAFVQDEDRFYSFQGSVWVDILNVIRAIDQPAGTYVGRAYAEYTANADLTTAIPIDDTIPQNTEGTEIVTASITLAKSTNRVRARFQAFGRCVSSQADDNRNWTAALFVDSTANALRAVAGGIANDNIGVSVVASTVLEFEHAPGSVGPLTYKIRVGGQSGDTLRLNGAGARFYGGVAAATLVLEEIAA